MTDEPERPAGQPMLLTPNARLDFALRLGWENWERVARRAGADDVAGWLRARLRRPDLASDATDLVRSLVEAEDAEDQAVLRAELAELLEGEDDELADTLWEGVLTHGRETGDADYIVEATRRLAAIAEGYGDPLAAAEYYIDFLNWRREGEHTSEIEPVEEAFEEIIRLAEVDGERAAAALFTHRYATYQRRVDADHESATTGDWETKTVPYASWS